MANRSIYTPAHVRLAAGAGDYEGARKIADDLNLSAKEREALGLKSSDEASKIEEGRKSTDSAPLFISPLFLKAATFFLNCESQTFTTPVRSI